jgi:type II secretory pathway pseudopilin PulG
MRGRLSSKAITPLLEVVVILFFFAFMSTMVLRLFVMSYQRSILARDINQALWAAQDAAEELRGSIVFLPVDVPDGTVWQGYELRYSQEYDADWNPIDTEDGVYRMSYGMLWDRHDAGALLTGSIVVVRKADANHDGVELCVLPVAHFVPIGGGP